MRGRIAGLSAKEIEDRLPEISEFTGLGDSTLWAFFPDTQSSSFVQQIDKAESIAPTDKTELPQTETIAPKPLPAAADPGYLAACQKLKETYVAEYNAKHADENKRHVDAQQSIINKYSAAGMSFSLKQKTAHSAEVKRHDSFQKQLEAQHQKQLAELRC